MKSEIYKNQAIKENDLVEYLHSNGLVILMVRNCDHSIFDGTVLYTENSSFDLGDFKRGIPLDNYTSKFTGTLILKNE